MFQSLRDEALVFWTDATFRRQQFQAIMAAHTAGNQRALQEHVTRVDAVITEGLADLGYPRYPVTRISVESLPGVAGLKQPDCHLKLGVEELADALAGSVDDVVVTWMHESVHGRHGSWTTASPAAWSHVGFEEGLAEGVSNSVTRRVGLSVSEPLYPHYLRAYELLADRLQVGPEVLFHRLWRARHDQIEERFGRTVAAIMKATTGGELTPIQRGKLLLAARTLFATGRHAELPDDVAIRETWGTAL